MTASLSSFGAERAILGCILEDRDVLPQAVDLVPEDFSLSSHACIFGHLLALSKVGEPLDVVTLAAHLESSSELERVGGFEYVAGLVDGVVRPNFSAYAKTVKDFARRRKLTNAVRAFVAQAEDPSVANGEVVIALNNLSAAYRNGIAAERKIQFRTAVQLAAQNSDSVKWVARPWVAAGAITLVIGKVKAAGKTTLFTHLVRSVLEGSPFLGTPTGKGPVVYLSEQSDATFRVALQRVGLLQNGDLRVVTWAEASRLPWAELVRLAVLECGRIGAVLLVVDTIGQFTGLVGDAENSAGDALRAMQPLQHAAAEGLGVLVSQHERKSGGEVEDAGRGSSAFAGAADIVLNIRRLQGNSSPNLRTIRALSRFDDTPAELTAELTTNGYELRDTLSIASQLAEKAILAVLPGSEAQAMTAGHLFDVADVKRTVGQGALNALAEAHRLAKIGKGHKGDPYRYFSPEIHSAGTKSYRRQKESGEQKDEERPPEYEARRSCAGTSRLLD